MDVPLFTGLTYGWKAMKQIIYYPTVFALFDILDMTRAISKYNSPGLILRGEI